MTTHIQTRLATLDDLNFVSQDDSLPEMVVQRKILEAEVFVALIEDQRVGYLYLEHLWSRIPFIALIRVLPAYRRQGVGKALLDLIGITLRQRGHTLLYSSSQLNEPEPQAWHRHVGFEECGIIAGMNDGVGEVFFRKQLP